MKTSDGVRAAHGAGQLAQGLAHQPGLDADERVAHLAFDLGSRHEGRHGVEDDAVDAARADEGLGDLERLLAGVRLADEELVDVHPAGPGVAGIEGMLDVDERGHAAARLRLGDDVLADGGLARRLRAEDLGDPAARDATDAEGQVERDRAGRDRVDRLSLGRAELHDRAAPELLLDGQDRRIDGLVSVRRRAFSPLRSSSRSPVIVIASRSCRHPSTERRDGRRSVDQLSSEDSSGSGLRLARLADQLDVLRRIHQRLQLGRALVLGLLLRFAAGDDPGNPSTNLRDVANGTRRTFTPTALPLHRADPGRARAQFRE